MISFLQHHLLPHHTNNHRPKVLHHHSLLFLILFLVFLLGLTAAVHKEYPSVLGISANMSAEELVTITNQKRQEKGLAPLQLNKQLSQAAALKAQNMLEKNYWAHTAPDGATPWGFIRTAGYEYLYAGENLARGYTTAPEVVDAWMASPTHRDNMLSGNYTDIGFAITTGSLTGAETVLVVEMFGKPYVGDDEETVAIAAAEVVPSVSPVIIVEALTPTLAALDTISEQPDIAPAVAAVQNEPLVDSPSAKRNISLFILLFLIIVLAVDAIIVERRKIARVVSHNIDHIIYLAILVIAAIVLGTGSIL